MTSLVDGKTTCWRIYGTYIATNSRFEDEMCMIYILKFRGSGQSTRIETRI